MDRGHIRPSAEASHPACRHFQARVLTVSGTPSSSPWKGGADSTPFGDFIELSTEVRVRIYNYWLTIDKIFPYLEKQLEEE